MIVSNFWWGLLATVLASISPLIFWLGFRKHNALAAKLFGKAATAIGTIGATLTFVNSFGMDREIGHGWLIGGVASGAVVCFVLVIIGNRTRNWHWWTFGVTALATLATAGVTTLYPEFGLHSRVDPRIALVVLAFAWTLVWSWPRRP